MSRTKRAIKKARLFADVILFAIVIAAIVLIAIVKNNSSIVDEKSVVTLRKGATYEVLLDSLGGKLSGEKRFRSVAKMMKLDHSVRAGRYELRPGMSARDVVAMFRGGAQTPLKITFNNIRTLDDLAGRLGNQLMADSAQFAELLDNDRTPARYGFTEAEFIGMFIPNTYEVYWTISPEALLDRLAQEYERFWSGSRADKLAALGMTSKEVSTLASIVEEETAIIDEMPAIAGVYINRLHRKMRLQADPTVKYAVGDPTLKRVLHKHLEVDSPYNTYKYAGLPPGPIRMPSIQAIDAVLNYQRHGYIYFCAKPDFSGRHAFAKTLSEHNRNAQAYSRALNAAGIR